MERIELKKPITVDNLDYVYKNIKALSDKLSLIYSNRNPQGFYFSSEDFVSFIKYLEATEEEILQGKKELEEEFV